MSNRKPSGIQSFDLLLMSAITGALFLAVSTALATFTSIPQHITGLIFLVIYCGVECWFCILALRNAAADRNVRESASLSSLMSETMRSIDFPAVITTVDGKIIWANNEMLSLCNSPSQAELAGQNFSAFSSRPMSEIITSQDEGGIRISIGEKHFKSKSYLLETPDRDYWMTVLDDCTALDEALHRVESESPVIAYVVLDNLEELAQYVRISYRSAANEIEGILRRWTLSLGGLLKEYDRDKYLIIFPREKLAECIENRFEILDAIRGVGIGDSSMSVTVSMGLSVCGDSVDERERDASAALETALQRGGDQAALRTEDGVEYFGGRTKIQQKRTKVRSRVIADRLIQLISDAGNVIVMGHKNPDFDSIGACLGLARLAGGYNSEVKIVIDRNNPNFRICTDPLLAEMPAMSNIFIDGGAGLDFVRSDTLLIIADVNNPAIIECPELLTGVGRCVIIDHHRKVGDLAIEPEIAYIEPSASSACELVSEILELSSLGSALPDGAHVTRQEASVMLAGIMLDTKNFTRSTSERTFSAALYLRGVGGSSEVARTFFYYDFDNFVTESRLGSNVKLYRGRIAITICPGTGSADDRIAASKTADTLLTVRQIDAAFVLLDTPGTVLVSGRSNGSINVQLILEKIGGGGHFDAAGAQISNSTKTDVLLKLRDAIDAYLDGE